jgi:RNA polymerase sigma-70 factor (ECF subfamily)
MGAVAGSDRGEPAPLRAILADEAAFRAWYERVLPRVWSYVFDRCGGPRSVAEEITQETFIDAVRSLDRFDGRADPVTWLCGIARHKLADHFRRLEREERRHLRLAAREATEDTAERPWRTADAREAVFGILRRLPAGQRAVLVLHYLDDLPVAEVAGLLRRSVTATEALLHRARASFRRIHDETQGDDDR